MSKKMDLEFLLQPPKSEKAEADDLSRNKLDEREARKKCKTITEGKPQTFGTRSLEGGKVHERNAKSSSCRTEEKLTKTSMALLQKPHACQDCEWSFHKREHLRRHKRLVHSNFRPYRCIYCNISFQTKQNLQIHMKTRKHNDVIQLRMRKI